MADDSVRHINLMDSNGKVYCHNGQAITELDGAHLSGWCWTCPFWCGLASGKGVECCYKDPNAGPGVDEVTFSNPQDALSAAPPEAKNLDSIASDDGIASRDARVATRPNEDDMDATDNSTTPPTEDQDQQGQPPPPTSVQASRAASHPIVKKALDDLVRAMAEEE